MFVVDSSVNSSAAFDLTRLPPVAVITGNDVCVCAALNCCNIIVLQEETLLWWAGVGVGVTSHVQRHTSHDARHTSHVTRPTSHVTRRTSHVTRHTSHVTRHTSHVARRTSHVTRQTSHVTGWQQWRANQRCQFIRPQLPCHRFAVCGLHFTVCVLRFAFCSLLFANYSLTHRRSTTRHVVRLELQRRRFLSLEQHERSQIR